MWQAAVVLSMQGVQKVSALSGVQDNSARDGGCSTPLSSFLGEISLLYERGFTQQLYSLLMAAPLGSKSS